MKLAKGTGIIQGSPRSILVIQLGDIGDVILNLPCFRALRECYPESNIVVAVRGKAADLLGDCPWIDDVISVNPQKENIFKTTLRQIEFVRRLRNFHFDLAIDMRTGTRGAIMAFLSGASQRIGQFAEDGTLWRNRVFSDLYCYEFIPDQYVADFCLDFFEQFGVVAKERKPQLHVAREREEEASSLLQSENVPLDKPVVALQPFSLWQYKEWGEDKYVALIRNIINKYDVSVIITGSPEERERAAAIVNKCGPGVFNLAGKTSLALLAAVLKHCGLFVGVDSAGVHIAAAVGTPTVSIFGPSSPKSWAPRGPEHIVVQKNFSCLPCRQKGCEGKEYSRCLDELSLDEVLPSIHKQLKPFLV